LKATTPLAYWTLGDASGTAAVDEMALGNGALGAAGAAPTLGAEGIGDGRTAMSFDGGDYVNIYSAALAAALTPAECSIMIWAKVSGVGIWSDAAIRYLFELRVDANNRIVIVRTVTANQIQGLYAAGGTTKTINFTTDARTTWFPLAVTVSKSADEVKFFFGGAQVGTTQTGISAATWAGVLNSTRCNLGVDTQAPGSPWSGSLAHAAVWNRALTPAEVAALASPFSSVSSLNVLPIGDSKTPDAWGNWEAELGASLLPNNVYVPGTIDPIGIGGITVDGMRQRVDADIAARTIVPNEVLINLGANDCTGTPVLEDWLADAQYIVDAHHTAYPNANIRVAKIWRQGKQTEYTIVNNAVTALYASRSFLKPAIDERNILPGADDGATMTIDGTHYSAAGNTAIAAAWKTAMGYA
jgi:lysophospholipase L1-like esterase